MELDAAREILAEVFGVKLSEVDEMIENRFQAGYRSNECPKGDRLWPQSFGWKDEAACYRPWSFSSSASSGRIKLAAAFIYDSLYLSAARSTSPILP